MPYPIITPEFFKEFADNNIPENNNMEYNVLTTPAAIEYVFPLNQERVIRRLMDTPGVLQYKMNSLKPELEEEYKKRGEEMIKANPVLKHYWALKILTMNILQNRHYVFEKRMLLLNFCYKTAQGMMDKFKEDLIPQLVSDFTKTQEHDDVIKFFESIQPNFIYSLCDGLSLMRVMPKTEEWEKIFFGVFKSINLDPKSQDFNVDENHYMQMKKEYYEDFLKGREHYIEHVMVNYAWTYCMPYADYNIPLWDNFVFFNTIFNTIKVMLTCYTYGKSDKDQAFLEAIKAFDDSLRFAKKNVVRRIVDVNISEGMMNNGDMAILSMS